MGRRKQKWAVDPRNTAWSNDDSKFGQRMLEKMGWSKGKGLGAQEQGATDHIKVQVKNNHLGLGATINNEDNWIAHQDDFNQLLAALNTCHGQETADSSDNKEKKSFSLEEKSKISKNRVHYMKFTKGKDLSSRSKTDLDCIFGKRQKKTTPERLSHLLDPNKRQILPEGSFLDSDQETSSPATPEGTDTSTTTTSAFTIHEYFAKRMAERKNKLQDTAEGPGVSETPLRSKRGKKRKKEAKDKSVENGTQPKAKKKRARAEWQLGDPGRDENSGVSAEDGEDSREVLSDQDFPLKPRRRKEKKKLPKPVEAAVASMLDETPVKKKKKKKDSE
ncbi:PIN2/TERF1-interacting telomerase inhibitor 1 isoform X2 [Phacochoerus africanus]|uniref:PIN2/TERF1-interacting telomerase inhibitor 1 isoform X2 n=1 Tax=Phacochoerus africanus TaxID=41426 RepID=UPI001FD9F48B|nr:PIN2/TERF1-interacting telomerase inhibitor 1 isoform X2 [Phacochoerus africanus]